MLLEKNWAFLKKWSIFLYGQTSELRFASVSSCGCQTLQLIYHAVSKVSESQLGHLHLNLQCLWHLIQWACVKMLRPTQWPLPLNYQAWCRKQSTLTPMTITESLVRTSWRRRGRRMVTVGRCSYGRFLWGLGDKSLTQQQVGARLGLRGCPL